MSWNHCDVWTGPVESLPSESKRLIRLADTPDGWYWSPGRDCLCCVRWLPTKKEQLAGPYPTRAEALAGGLEYLLPLAAKHKAGTEDSWARGYATKSELIAATRELAALEKLAKDEADQ